MTKSKRAMRRVAVKLINTHQAKSELFKLIRQVEEQGISVRICRDGKPVAEFVPINSSADILSADPELARISFRENPSTPISEEDWPTELR